MPKRAATLELRPSGMLELPLKEPSDVVALPDGALFVVSDLAARGVLVGARGSMREVELSGVPKGASGFEALAYDERAKHLYVASEESRVLFRYDLKLSARAASAKLDATLELALPGGRGKKSRNKGIEGMAFLPPEHSPTKSAALLVAREGNPRALFLIEPGRAAHPIELSLDPSIEAACEDFSGLALDRASGRVYLCSDESASLAELELSGGATAPHAVLIAAAPLTNVRGKPLKRVEGVAVDSSGAIWVLLEDERVLMRFDRA